MAFQKYWRFPLKQFLKASLLEPRPFRTWIFQILSPHLHVYRQQRPQKQMVPRSHCLYHQHVLTPLQEHFRRVRDCSSAFLTLISCFLSAILKLGI